MCMPTHHTHAHSRTPAPPLHTGHLRPAQAGEHQPGGAGGPAAGGARGGAVGVGGALAGRCAGLGLVLVPRACAAACVCGAAHAGGAWVGGGCCGSGGTCVRRRALHLPSPHNRSGRRGAARRSHARPMPLLACLVAKPIAEVYALMERGAAARATGATKLNEISSRSHAIFMLIVEKSTLVEAAAGGQGGGGEQYGGMLPGARAAPGGGCVGVWQGGSSAWQAAGAGACGAAACLPGPAWTSRRRPPPARLARSHLDAALRRAAGVVQARRAAAPPRPAARRGRASTWAS